MSALLEIDKLTVRFGASIVVDQVSFSIAAGEKFGLVGESGSGKSITALSVLRLVDAATSSGAIRFDDEDLMAKSEREMRGIRGARIGMIFQEPMTALNPLRTIGDQIGEMFTEHTDLSKAAIRERVLALLDQRLLYWPMVGERGSAESVVKDWTRAMRRIHETGALLAGYAAGAMLGWVARRVIDRAGTA